MDVSAVRLAIYSTRGRADHCAFFYAAILREYCEKDHSLGFELLKRISAVMVRRLQVAHDQMLSLYHKPRVA